MRKKYTRSLLAPDKVDIIIISIFGGGIEKKFPRGAARARDFSNNAFVFETPFFLFSFVYFNRGALTVHWTKIGHVVVSFVRPISTNPQKKKKNSTGNKNNTWAERPRAQQGKHESFVKK